MEALSIVEHVVEKHQSTVSFIGIWGVLNTTAMASCLNVEIPLSFNFAVLYIGGYQLQYFSTLSLGLCDVFYSVTCRPWRRECAWAERRERSRAKRKSAMYARHGFAGCTPQIFSGAQS